jgi:cell division protein FtsI (penicillin-binding protein 3)
MKVKKDIIWRIGIIYVLIVGSAVGVVARILYLQIAEGEKYQQMADEIAQMDMAVMPNRGIIYSSDGKPLVSSIPYYELRMDLHSSVVSDNVFDENVDSLAACLANEFKDKTKEIYKRNLIREREEGNRYYLIKRYVDYNRISEIKKFPIFNKGRYSGGMIIEQKKKRTRLFDELARRTLGKLIDNKGYLGLELAYEEELRGKEGVRLMQKTSDGRWVPIKDENEVEPVDGYDLITTLDLKIQDVAHTALLNQLKKHKAKYGCAVLMEVTTGEVKAIVNLGYDSVSDAYWEDYNYAIGARTEPGSTFKLASLMVAMEDGYITIDSEVDAGNGVYEYAKGVYMRDERAFHVMTAKEALEHSSNIGVSRFVYDNYKNDNYKYLDGLKKLGMYDMLDLEILGGKKPKIKDPSGDWSGVTLPWMSTGYSVEFTPMQILAFYNAVANNGVKVKPHFVKHLKYHGEIEKSFSAEVLVDKIASDKTIKQAQEMLKGVGENGTARRISTKELKVAGKTGTAKKLINGEYSNKYYQASFVGYFPADDPLYSCIVVVSEPLKSTGYHGAEVAGPVFKEIATKVYSMNMKLQEDIADSELDNDDLLPETLSGFQNHIKEVVDYSDVENDLGNNISWVDIINNEEVLETIPRYKDRFINDEMPDVIGMGARDAVFLLENAGYDVTLEGRGKVISQDTLLNSNNIILKLK